MTPQNLVTKNPRKKRSAETLSQKDLIRLIPLWREIGAVLGYIRINEQIPVMSPEVSKAIFHLNEIEKSPKFSLSYELQADIADEFDFFVSEFARVLLLHHSKKKSQNNGTGEDLKRGISLYKKFLGKNAVGGEWKPHFEERLLSNVHWPKKKGQPIQVSDYGLERHVAEILSLALADRTRKICNREKYDKRKKKNGKVDNGAIVKPDFNWWHYILNAVEAPEEELNTYKSEKVKGRRSEL